MEKPGGLDARDAVPPRCRMRLSVLSVLLASAVWAGCQCGPSPAGTPADGGEDSIDGSVDGADASVGLDAAHLVVVCTVPRPTQGPVPAECATPPVGACSSSKDCPSGLCLNLTTGARCTATCKVDGDCSGTERCRVVDSIGEGYCLPKSRGTP